MTTISGMAIGAEQRADRDVDLAGMKTMAQPMPAISASDAWPSTLVMLRMEKKFSAVNEKKAMSRSRQSSSAIS